MGKLFGKTIPLKIYDVLKNTTFKKAFMAFAKSELSADNVYFLLAQPKVNTLDKARQLHVQFIARGPAQEINIGGGLRNNAENLYQQPGTTYADWTDVLRQCTNEAFKMVEFGTLLNFKRSDAFAKVCFRIADPKKVARTCGVRTPAGKQSIKDAIIAAAKADYSKVQKKGLELFRDMKEPGFKISPKDFVVGIVSGEFKEPKAERKGVEDEIAKKSGPTDELEGRKVKNFLKLLGIKKFDKTESHTVLKYLVNAQNERDRTVVSSAFKRLKILEESFQDPSLTIEEVIIVLKKAKLVKR